MAEIEPLPPPQTHIHLPNLISLQSEIKTLPGGERQHFPPVWCHRTHKEWARCPLRGWRVDCSRAGRWHEGGWVGLEETLGCSTHYHHPDLCCSHKGETGVVCWKRQWPKQGYNQSAKRKGEQNQDSNPANVSRHDVSDHKRTARWLPFAIIYRLD